MGKTYIIVIEDESQRDGFIHNGIVKSMQERGDLVLVQHISTISENLRRVHRIENFSTPNFDVEIGRSGLVAVPRMRIPIERLEMPQLHNAEFFPSKDKKIPFYQKTPGSKRFPPRR